VGVCLNFILFTFTQTTVYASTATQKSQIQSLLNFSNIVVIGPELHKSIFMMGSNLLDNTSPLPLLFVPFVTIIRPVTPNFRGQGKPTSSSLALTCYDVL